MKLCCGINVNSAFEQKRFLSPLELGRSSKDGMRVSCVSKILISTERVTPHIYSGLLTQHLFLYSAEMSLGEKAKLHITPDYGYGARGAGGVIPPTAELDFEVDLLAINGQA